MDLSRVLICTDYDGTLSFGGVCQRNVDAIGRFCEAGGKFTLCTGRGGGEILNKDYLPVWPNTYMSCYTGAQVYDAVNQREHCSFLITEGIEGFVKDMLITDMNITQIRIDTPDYAKRSGGEYGDGRAPLINVEDKKGVEDELSRVACGAYKIVMKIEDSTETVPPLAREIADKNGLEATCNIRPFVEFTKKGVNKGVAVLKLKELCRADTLICVGDNIGDIAMIKAADIGYAVDNAADELKAVADRITVHAKDGAIAAIIEEILKHPERF